LQGVDPQFVSTVALAAVGGFMLNIMNLWEDSKRAKPERVPKDFLYWLFFILWPIIGGGLALVYYLDGSVLRPFASFTLGLGAPATLKALMSTAAQPSLPPPGAE
jgi:hypothetical protein